ncbi:hypothetical protein ACJIZ3_014419 [Penstemon smallii]|uniref:Uncharacterized protein n=1 Tax=Penstemon smallii TaxID=265156 RepID=A0ABD3RMY5_9LAMI
MGEYGVTDSWNKRLTIRLPKNCEFPLGFTKNGMLVCEEHKPEDRPSRSSKKHIESTKKIRKKVPGFIFLDVENFEEEAVMVIDYKESLALLM